MFRRGRSYTQPFLLSLLLTLFLPPLLSAHTQASELRRLAVIGVANTTSEKEFNNLLIAQGIAHLAAQELYDTGSYVPVEDNPEINKRITDLVTLSAQTGSADADPEKALSAGKDLGCDTVASIKISKFSKSRAKSGIGPFSSAKVEIEIEIEVTLKDNDKPAVSAKGKGSGTTKSQGFLFKVREDKVHFDQTSVGQATHEAIKMAVKQLAAHKPEVK